MGAVEGRGRFILLNLALITIFTVGLFLMLGKELLNPWTAAVGVLAFLLALATSNYVALAKAHTVVSLPPAVVWRRRCFNYGMLVYAVAQVVAFISRPYVPVGDWTHYIQITGFVIFCIFIVAGCAHRPGFNRGAQTN